MKDLLYAPVKIKATSLLVKEISFRPVTLTGGQDGVKIVLHTEDPTGTGIELSDAWVRVGDRAVIKGLWAPKDSDSGIPSQSSVGKLLARYGKATLIELKGQTIEAYPDPRDFLVASALNEQDASLIKVG
jgi:hypothetical protein